MMNAFAATNAPIAEEKKVQASEPALYASLTPTFLNVRDQRVTVALSARRELGILARVALVFSRRGLDVENLRMDDDQAKGKIMIVLTFWGSEEQQRLVVNDLKKLIDVEQVQVHFTPLHRDAGASVGVLLDGSDSQVATGPAQQSDHKDTYSAPFGQSVIGQTLNPRFSHVEQ